jgi:hypothetical protein
LIERKKLKGETEMKKIFALIAALILMGSVASFAATTQDVDMDIEIPSLFKLDWNLNGSLVQLTGANKITLNEYIAGYKDAIDGGSLVVNANLPWDLTVVADADNFVGGSNTKPTSDLAVDLDGSYTYPNSVNGLTPVVLLSNIPAVQDEIHAVAYKINFQPADIEGTYSTTLTYTLLPH